MNTAAEAMTIDTAAVRAFFDGLAPAWDSGRITREDILREIMDFADITPGCRVLDVACGTGVLVPYYLERGAVQVTGVDLSPEMIRLAAAKCQDSRAAFLAGDVLALDLGVFDRVVVLNALPHFPDPEALAARLADRLAPGGRLTIAHDRPRQDINRHHSRTAGEVSRGLPPAEETAAWLRRYLTVDAVVEDGEKYVVSGVRPAQP